MQREQIENILERIHPKPILTDSRNRYSKSKYIFLLGAEWTVSDFMFALIVASMTPGAALFAAKDIYSYRIPTTMNLVIVQSARIAADINRTHFPNVQFLAPGNIPAYSSLGGVVGEAVITALSRPPTILSRIISTYVRVSNRNTTTLESLSDWDSREGVTAAGIRNWCNYTTRLIHCGDMDKIVKYLRNYERIPPAIIDSIRDGITLDKKSKV